MREFPLDRSSVTLTTITPRMTTQTIGIILNGATGRICSTQHVANALAPIRDEGGLPAGDDRIVPRLMLVGRNAEKLAAVAQKLRRGMDHRSRRGAGRSGLHACSSTPPRPASARACWKRRSPRASTSIPRSRWRCRSTRGWSCCAPCKARGLKHGAVEDKLCLPGLQKLSRLAASDFFGRVVGFRIEFGWWVFDGTEVPCQRPSWNYRKKDGGGLILDMYPHWRYVIENMLGPMRRVVTLAVDGDARSGSTSTARATTSTSRTTPRRWSSWRAARPARSCRPGRRGCAATIC